MPKIAKELSQRAVLAISADGRHAVGGAPGLHLRVTGGHRGWVLRVTVGDQRRDLGLGPFPEVSLADARDKARDIHKQIRAGVAPLSDKKLQQRAFQHQSAKDKDFDWCVEEFLKSKSDEWKNAKHRQQWQNTLKTYASPHIGSMSVSDLDLPHVLLCLEPIWKSKNETASRLRGRLEAVLDWATVRKYRAGENPARWKGHLDKVLPAPSKIQKVQHHPAVALSDMKKFAGDLRSRAGSSARALELAMLTAARSGEVRGATWAEFDLEAKLWTVPGERMKAGRVHRVPLSAPALKLLAALPKGNRDDLVFPGRNKTALSDMSLSAVMRRMKLTAVPHGLRSTFRDWVYDRTTFPRELAETALAHVNENKTEEAYRRSDALERRREMMTAWAEFIGYGPKADIAKPQT